MHINSVTQAAPAAPAVEKTSPAATGAKTPAAGVVTASQVSAAVVQRANSDGDGRTGSAALNDGDAAAHAAASSRRVNVHA